MAGPPLVDHGEIIPPFFSLADTAMNESEEGSTSFSGQLKSYYCRGGGEGFPRETEQL